jgi:hypothetical protein
VRWRSLGAAPHPFCCLGTGRTSLDANVILLITGILSPLTTLAAGFGGVWWASRLTQNSLREQREEERKERERQHEEESEGTRRLVASEVISNFNDLYILAGRLTMTPGQRNAIVATFDRAFLPPDWRRMQWDKASAAAFSADELYRINDWYNQLEAITTLIKNDAAHCSMFREQQQAQPTNALALRQVIVDMLVDLKQFVRGVYEQGRPFVHERIDEAHEKERLRRETLERKQAEPANNGTEEADAGS